MMADHTTTTWGSCRRCDRLLHKSFAGLCPECRDELCRYIAATKGLSQDPNCLPEHDRTLIDQDIDAERYWPRPIPVSERLPEVGQRVLIVTDGRWGPDVSGWHSARFVSDDRGLSQSSCYTGFTAIAGPCNWRVDEVTHWLPMPPKPE